MAYSEFSFLALEERFGLRFLTEVNFHAGVTPLPPSALLAATLAENTQLALNMGTEKARSELIVAPVLVEVRRLCDRRVSLFSGVEFNVDGARGLVGVCDFLLSASPNPFVPEAPVFCVVEAKKGDLGEGIPQCAAEMLAVQMFNERRGHPLPAVHGTVTSGSSWRFLRLVERVVSVSPEYPLVPVDLLLGLFNRSMREALGADAASSVVTPG